MTKAPEGWRAWYDPTVPIRLGVSSCLLGEEVRYDGGHQRDRFLLERLGRFVEWVSVCPEVEVGLPTPRPALRLVEKGDERRLVAPSTGEDHTEAMRAFTTSKARTLWELGLDGFVLNKNSPSCGMERVSVYGERGRKHRRGVGMFAEGLLRAAPDLPVEEGGRLSDARLRESFIERVFARNRWRVANLRGLTRERLVRFHTVHKFLLRSHNEAAYQRLGQVVASLGQRSDDVVFAEYGTRFQACLARPASPRKHTNVLLHAVGYVKDRLPRPEKKLLLGAIEDFRTGLIPLIVPLTLMRAHAHRFESTYLCEQLYLDPHPKELMLRNHV